MYTWNRRFRCNAKLYKMGRVYYRYHSLQKSKIIAENICQSNISMYQHIKNIVTAKLSLYMCIHINTFLNCTIGGACSKPQEYC